VSFGSWVVVTKYRWCCYIDAAPNFRPLALRHPPHCRLPHPGADPPLPRDTRRGLGSPTGGQAASDRRVPAPGVRVRRSGQGPDSDAGLMRQRHFNAAVKLATAAPGLAAAARGAWPVRTPDQAEPGDRHGRGRLGPSFGSGLAQNQRPGNYSNRVGLDCSALWAAGGGDHVIVVRWTAGRRLPGSSAAAASSGAHQLLFAVREFGRLLRAQDASAQLEETGYCVLDDAVSNARCVCKLHTSSLS
jgi:hypothetical protein